MSTNDEPVTHPSRRRFVAGALGLGGGAVLAGLAGCRGGADDGQAAQPPTKPATAPVAVPSVAVPAVAAPEPVAAVSGLPEGKNPADFIVHGTHPVTLETRRELMGTSVLTATRHLFVRQNLPLPPLSFVADRDAWTTQFSGVARAAELSVETLKTLGVQTVAMVLQCSGNGRKYYAHGPGGSPWGVGAAGCVMWSGVPLKKVVEHLGGLEAGVRFVTTTGGEPLPADVARDDVVVERSIPIDKGLDDCLLAWEMNGEPIPHCHGGPLRLIVPGYYGCNQIKFVKQVAFTAEQTRAKIQRTGYRMRPIGEHGAPEQPSMWAMAVKSFITGPSDALPVREGKVQVTGVAFAGTEPVTRVQISIDGERWLPTEWVGPELGPNAWRVFSAELELAAGKHTLFSRATAKSGATQPELRQENERGYGNNSYRDMAVSVSVCAADDAACLAERPLPVGKRKPPVGPIELSESARRGRDVFSHSATPPCATCHTLADAQAVGAVGPRLDELQRSFEQVKSTVQNGVGVMPPFGKTLTPEQLEDVARYVYEVMHAE